MRMAHNNTVYSTELAGCLRRRNEQQPDESADAAVPCVEGARGQVKLEKFHRLAPDGMGWGCVVPENRAGEMRVGPQ